MQKNILPLLAALFASSALLPASAQVPFTLKDQNQMVTKGGKLESVEYLGRKAIRLTTGSEGDVFAFLKGAQIQDGTIEADIAVKITTPPWCPHAGIYRCGIPDHAGCFALRFVLSAAAKFSR